MPLAPNLFESIEVIDAVDVGIKLMQATRPACGRGDILGPEGGGIHRVPKFKFALS